MFRVLSAALLSSAATAAWAEEISFDWSAEHRTRYESLSGQFRNGFDGSDQAIVMRTLIAGEATAGILTLGGELQDSRAYLDDEGSAIGVNVVDAAEILQAYLAIDLADASGADAASLTLGRQTLDIGSGRLVGRQNFRNTINAFTGARWRWAKGENGWEAFVVVPIEKRPSSTDGIRDNVIQIDKENDDVLLWGVFHSRGGLPFGATAEAYYYGLDYEAEGFAPDQTLHTPGFRVLTKPKVNALDVEIEGALQFGDRESLVLPSLATETLDVFAQYAHVEIGFTYDARFTPRVSVVYDFASGDENSADGDYERFNGLFGPVVGDFGPTDIFTAFGRENISSPGLKIEGSHTDKAKAFVRYRAFFLDAPADAWVRAGVRDLSGGSGDLVGHQVDARAQWTVIPDRVSMAAGGAVLARGPFALDAATGDKDPVSYFGYVEATLRF